MAKMATLYGENIAADFDDKLGNSVCDSLPESEGRVFDQPTTVQRKPPSFPPTTHLLGADNMGGIRSTYTKLVGRH